MVNLQQEMLFEVVNEVDELLRLHYEELTLNKDKVTLEPRWDQYAALESLGMFTVFTARTDDGNLIGYSAFFINRHMHYAGLNVAINDVLFLHPDYRGGTNGTRLIKFSHEQLAGRGDINKIIFHIKFSKDWSKILHKMGYVDEEKSVAKIL